jgi:hypothetical protein
MTKMPRLFVALTAAALSLAPIASAQTAALPTPLLALPTPLLTSDTAQLEVFAQTPAVAVVTYYSADPSARDTRILGEGTLNWRSNAARAADIRTRAPAGTQFVRVYTNGQATLLAYDAGLAARLDTLADQNGGELPVQALN